MTDLTTIQWLKAASGALLYLEKTGKKPPGLDLLLSGIYRHLVKCGEDDDVPLLRRVTGGSDG